MNTRLLALLLFGSTTALAEPAPPTPAERLRQLQALDYAAYQGEAAAIRELCRLESRNLALEYNPTKAEFWCARARPLPANPKVAGP